MVMDSVPPPSRPRKIELKEVEDLVWEEFDAGMTAGPTDDEVQVSYTNNGEQVITVVNRANKTNSMILDLDAMADNTWTEKNSARQAIMNARRKRNAELQEEAVNKELRELNPDWGSW